MTFCLDKKTELELRALQGNALCVDCDGRGPQWASVTFGVFMCLDCSGKHRSLGVHISFVRSVTMDSWSPDQIQIMRLGGNAKCNAFLSQYNSLHKVSSGSNIFMKYNSPAAALYKDRLRCEVEGKPLPTELPKEEPSYAGGSSSAEPINGETEDAYVKRQQRQREEAQERLRQKFGNSTGLKGGSSMAGMGSDSSYRSGGENNDSDGFAMPNISLADLGISADSTKKLKEDAAKALDSTWSWAASSWGAVSETVTKAAADLSESGSTYVSTVSLGRYSGGDDGRSQSQQQSQPEPSRIQVQGQQLQQQQQQGEDTDDFTKNWEFVKSSAFDFWSKATDVTKDVVKTISEIQGGSDDEEVGAGNGFFSKSELAGLSTGKMSGFGASASPRTNDMERERSSHLASSSSSSSSAVRPLPRVSSTSSVGSNGGGVGFGMASRSTSGDSFSSGNGNGSITVSAPSSGSGKSSLGAKKIVTLAEEDGDFFHSFGMK